MNILKIVLAGYLLGWIIYYVLSFQDLDEIAFVAENLLKDVDDPLEIRPSLSAPKLQPLPVKYGVHHWF